MSLVLKKGQKVLLCRHFALPRDTRPSHMKLYEGEDSAVVALCFDCAFDVIAGRALLDTLLTLDMVLDRDLTLQTLQTEVTS